MYTESRRLSQLQVAESLLKDYDSSCRTLHTDGTSKFGKHYGTYDVVTDQGQTLIAGIREVSSGDTETQLNVLLDILSEIEESLLDAEKNVSNKIISSIKNIMSYRHIVQKNWIVFFKIIVHLFCQMLLKIGMQWMKTFKVTLLKWNIFFVAFIS